MKKILFIVACITLASCKKEYSCTCTNPSGSTVVFTEKMTKGKASEKCDDYYNDHYGSVPFNETSCEIN
ncbi:MAG TPA: hypothetical protein VGC65_05635 [Bacteroidia bacterium]|jgi:hypothetical protein